MATPSFPCSVTRKLRLLLLGGLLTSLAMVTGQKPASGPSIANAVATMPAAGFAALKNSNMAFIQNEGQWDARAQFLAKAPGMNMWITEDGAVFDFRAEGSRIENERNPAENRNAVRGHVVRMEFVGGRPSTVTGEGRLDGHLSYFLGKDSSKWASDVSRYQEARSERVYDGVEARWYFDQGRPRYDLVVAPGANPAQIAMRYVGANGVGMRGSSLVLGTSLGDVEHRGLFAYQKMNGATMQVPCTMTVNGNVVRFEVGAYDNSKPLIIDPIVWSTFVGGSGSGEQAFDLARDTNGNIVFTGYSQSSDFPVTTGAYDEVANGGFDGVVGSLSADGSTLNWATYLGGDSTDGGIGLDLDSSDQPYVVGYTYSTGFPTTVGAWDTTHNGNSDTFVTKLNSTGTALIYSTFYGGSQFEFIRDCDEVGGLLYAVGDTNSAGLPVFGSPDSTYNGGASDGYIFVLNAAGSSLFQTSYIGGSGNDYASGMVHDGVQAFYISVTTGSSDFPISGPVYDSTINGNADAAIVQFFDTGDGFGNSTFLGGTGPDTSVDIALDASKNPIIVGYTTSTDFPTTASAFDKTIDAGNDMFVAKLSSNLSTLEASTYLGSAGNDGPYKIEVDQFGNPLIAGRTNAPGFPTTAGAVSQLWWGGYDAIVAKLNGSLSKLLYGTYLGRSFDDTAAAAITDGGGDLIIGGTTGNSDFPTTSGAYDETSNGGSEIFLTKLNLRPFLWELTSPNTKVVGGFQFPMTLRLTQPAVPGGTTVNLSTNTPGKVFVPATLKVKEGATTRTIGVRTETVLTDTDITVTASHNGGSDTITVTLRPGGLQSLKLAGTSISKFQFGQGSVTLSAPVPAKVERIVALRSRNPLALWVPETAVVRETYSSAGFPIYGLNVLVPTNVTVEGKLGNMTKTDTITVNP